MTRLSRLIGTAALACALSTPAQAAPIIGDRRSIATGGDVAVTFVSNGAGYTASGLSRGTPPVTASEPNLQSAGRRPISASLNLGTFLAGTELIFSAGRASDTG